MILALCCGLCEAHESPVVRTYADLEAELTRTGARYYESQLTQHPEKDLDRTELTQTLFYQLPSQERVIYIMNSFADCVLDGEYGEQMYLMLTHRNNPWHDGNIPDPTSEDKAYTRTVFKMIDSFGEAKVRAFCSTPENYDRFQKNLKTWKKNCGYNE
jgi:hypothetical protein